MTKLNLAIFEDERLIQIETASKRIVDALSSNYQVIIDSMVGRSQNTKTTYKRNIKHFLAFIQANGIHGRSCANYHNALAKISTDILKPKTKNDYLTAMRAFIRESLTHGILPVDISKNIKGFKVSNDHVKDGIQGEDGTNGNEAKMVWDYIISIEKPQKRERLKMMYRLLANGGLRQMEMVQIKIEEIKFIDQAVYFRPKGYDGEKSELVFSSTIKALKEYATFLGRSEGYLFPSPKDPGKPLSLSAIRKLFTRPKYGIFYKAGVTGRSVHGFRHYFITTVGLATNGNIDSMMKLGRIKTPVVIKRYNDRKKTKELLNSVESYFITE